MSISEEMFGEGKLVQLRPPPGLVRKGSVEGVQNFKQVFKRIWTDGSDPFEKAAEKVREDGRWGRGRTRRSRSVSPWTINDLNLSEDFSQDPRVIGQVAEPKGLVIARKLRPLTMKQSLNPSIPDKNRSSVKGFLCRSEANQNFQFKSSTKNESGQSEIKTVARYIPRPKMLICLGSHIHSC